MRSCSLDRVTRETIVNVAVTLDEASGTAIATGMPMFDHLLAQFGFYGALGLTVEVRSLDAIRHHAIEDVAIVLGRAISGALGERRGIARFAAVTLPMDDALVRVALDLGGRPYARANLDPGAAAVEGLELVLVRHFFTSLAAEARVCLHVDLLEGTDPHHCVEAAFKALGRACRDAWRIETPDLVASTKGVLL